MPEEIMIKTYDAETKEVEGERAFEVTITTTAVDRDGDIVEAKGAKLTNYRKNPVVLMAHDYRGLPIGKAENLVKTDDDIKAKVIFPPEGDYPLADIVHRLYKGKFMRAWSIGFIPIKTEDIVDEDNGGKGGEDSIRRGGRRIKSWELLEFSACAVPSNPEALTNMVAKGINIDTLKEAGFIEIEEDEKEIILKPEETDEFIHIPVRSAADFVKDSFRTIDIDAKKGIKAVIGKLKSDPQGSTHVQKYIFDKGKGWTLSSAQEWVRKHGKSIIYQCVICGKYFMDSPSANRKTCSTKCGYKYLSQLNSGENHPQYKGGKEKRICEQCGEIFEVYRKGNNQKYCSKKCHNESMEIEKEIGICLICNKEFNYNPNRPRIYCSRECFYKGNREFIKNLNKDNQLSEAQLEALENGRLNRFGGYQTECNDGHIVQSKFEGIFDDWLYKEGIKHNIQVRVCKERYWTCDFVLINSDGNSLWVEIDGMGELRKEYGHKETWEEKIDYYNENDYRFMIIDKDNIEESKNELKKIFPKSEEQEEQNKSFNPNEIYEIVKENKELKEKVDKLENENKELELKAGAVLNKRNKQDLKDAQAKIQNVLDSAEPIEEDSLEIEDTKDIKDDDTGIDIEVSDIDDVMVDKGIDETKLKEIIEKTFEESNKSIKEHLNKKLGYITGRVK